MADNRGRKLPALVWTWCGMCLLTAGCQTTPLYPGARGGYAAREHLRVGLAPPTAARGSAHLARPETERRLGAVAPARPAQVYFHGAADKLAWRSAGGRGPQTAYLLTEGMHLAIRGQEPPTAGETPIDAEVLEDLVQASLPTAEPVPAIHHETVHVEPSFCNSVPRECHKTMLPTYVIEPPDILSLELRQGLPDQPLPRQALVRPDGSISLGLYGSVQVAGLTLEQARVVIEQHLAQTVKNPMAAVDVFAYNSKVYYVVTDGGGYGEQVYRLPITGNETVLDAMSQVNGLPAVASKKHIWLARPDCHSGQTQILPVDWCGITQRASTTTNYQLAPGDRLYVQADKLITFDSKVAKVLSPFERMLGFTLLGNTTIQSLRRGSNTGSGSNNGF